MERLLDWRWCSGDLTDSDGDHAITTFSWRAPILREFFRYIDLLGLVLRFPDGVHPSSGQFPMPRYDPEDVDSDGAILEPHRNGYVKGLPCNFYSSEWLEQLDEHERNALEMGPAVSLVLPRQAVEYVVFCLFRHPSDNNVGWQRRPSWSEDEILNHCLVIILSSTPYLVHIYTCCNLYLTSASRSSILH